MHPSVLEQGFAATSSVSAIVVEEAEEALRVKRVHLDDAQGSNDVESQPSDPRRQDPAEGTCAGKSIYWHGFIGSSMTPSLRDWIRVPVYIETHVVCLHIICLLCAGTEQCICLTICDIFNMNLCRAMAARSAVL